MRTGLGCWRPRRPGVFVIDRGSSGAQRLLPLSSPGAGSTFDVLRFHTCAFSCLWQRSRPYFLICSARLTATAMSDSVLGLKRLSTISCLVTGPTVDRRASLGI